MRSVLELHHTETFSQGERIRVLDRIVQCHRLVDETWSLTNWATNEHLASGLRESEMVFELHRLMNDEVEEEGL